MSKPIEIKGVWKYLQDSGVLDYGSAEDIEEARKTYWREFRRQNKAKRRLERPEINVALTGKTMLEMFTEAAKDHNRSLSAFIRDSVVAYLEKSFVNPNKQDWHKILQVLYKIEIEIRRISEDDLEAGNYHRNYELLIEKLMKLESEIESTLHNPRMLEHAIRETIQKKPWYKPQLEKIDSFIMIIKSKSHKNTGAYNSVLEYVTRKDAQY